MNAVIGARAPGWFRLLAVLGIAWNAFGVYMYLMKVGVVGNMAAQMGEADRVLAASAPAWYTGAFAIGVFAGLLGTIALALLSRWSKPLLILSLLGVLAQMGWIVGMSNAVALKGGQVLLIPALITVVAILLVWLAAIGGRRGWLG